MGNNGWGERGGGWGKDVNSIINTCLFVYCSLLGIFCTENIISKKKWSSSEQASNKAVAKPVCCCPRPLKRLV